MNASSDPPRRASLGARRSERNQPGSTMSFALLRALVIFMFGILTLQLINMQLIKGDEYERRVATNALREIPLTPARGLIYDRNMTPLVENSARFSVAVIPGDLPERGDETVFATISSVVGVSTAEIRALAEQGAATQGEYSPAIVKADIGRDAALELLELEPHTPGMRVLVEPSRRFTGGAAMSHLLGYVGPLSAEEYAEVDGYLFQDSIGKSGVELVYEDILRGELGTKLTEVDSSGKEIRTLDEERPLDGSNLVLSLDAELQAQAATVLQQYTDESEAATAVVMDVRSGEVLAMVSSPTYDNNMFAAPLSQDALSGLLEAPGKPLVNHALSDQFPPGDMFKVIVGGAALQEGVAKADTRITSRGYITVQNELDPNVVYIYSDRVALGPLDFATGLAQLSNVYSYYLAGGKSDEGFVGLGPDRLARYAEAFGFGSPTGIDLPGEAPGTVPDSTWKESTVGDPWTLGDTYDMGVGQGYIGANPLQVLRSVSAIANGGALVTPHLLREVRDNHGRTLSTTAPPASTTLPIDGSNLDLLRQAMRKSVVDGVSRPANVNGVAVAGVAGVAEFGPKDDAGKRATHGWFTGFAPFDNPEVAVVVFTDNGNGTDDASPAAARILDFYFHGPRLAAQPQVTP